MEKELREQRRALARTESNSYDASDFPGSRAWMEHAAHRKALKAFDLAHPEIIAAIMAERQTAEHAKYEAMSDFAKGGS